MHGHFYGNFTGNLAHAQSVCTRPFSRGEGPGDEASIISAKSVSGHFSSLHSFLWLIQELKFSTDHLVEDWVFFGTLGFDRSSSSSLLSVEKRLLFAGGWRS